MRSLVCMLLEKRCDAPTKMDPTDNENVLELNKMIDVWRIVDKYDIAQNIEINSNKVLY